MFFEMSEAEKSFRRKIARADLIFSEDVPYLAHQAHGYNLTVDLSETDYSQDMQMDEITEGYIYVLDKDGETVLAAMGVSNA